jgi:GrpB-like predicted nucleotidyltransferase (UPF0157 family)
MARTVEVVSYRIDWPEEFDREAKALRRIFGDQLITIHHFGSTAIPGISAKPIIDILLTVREIDSADALSDELEELGYNAVGEYGITGRRFFYKGTEELRSHHLHVYQFDNPHILRHLAFRDYMRTHPMTAHRYGQLKEELARQFPEDMDKYIAGKNAFVKEQEREALEWWEKKHRKVQSD